MTVPYKGPNYIPPSLRININQSNYLYLDEPTETPRECNNQPPAAHFKYIDYTPKTSPLVSAIMGRLNHHTIDNGDVEVQPLEFPVESNSGSVPDTDTTPIKSIYDDEMVHLLEILHSEHNDDILGVNLQMIQD